MEKQSFIRRFITPVFIIFIVMSMSWVVYNLSWRLTDPALHHILANISGTLLFLSVAFGTLVVYPMALFRGASLPMRIVASLINPFIWETKEFFRMLTSFGFLESLFYYLNPLNIWLLLGIITQMGLLEMVCRWRLKRRGEDVRVFSIGAITAFLLGLFLVIALYAWGRGENVFSYYLELYRMIFGPGTGI